MTKVTILGQKPKEEKKLKPIEFKRHLMSNLNFGTMCSNPRDYKNIELISKCHQRTGLDIMFAYDYDRSEGYLYLGHFNDGVVE